MLKRTSTQPVPQLSCNAFTNASVRLTGRKPPGKKLARTVSDSALQDQMAPMHEAAARRYIDITVAKNEVQAALTPVGLKGLTWGTAVGMSMASIIAVVITCVGLSIHIVPGLGLGLFVGTLLVGAAVGLIMQEVARRKAAADFGHHKAKLNELEAELLQIPKAIRSRTGDDENLEKVQLLQAQVNNTTKNKFAQVYAGILDSVRFSIEAFAGHPHLPQWSKFQRAK